MYQYLLKYIIHENVSVLIIITVTISNHYQYLYLFTNSSLISATIFYYY